LSILNLLAYKIVVHALVYILDKQVDGRDEHGPDPESIFLTPPVSDNHYLINCLIRQTLICLTRN